jgi:hypothetical protein
MWFVRMAAIPLAYGAEVLVVGVGAGLVLGFGYVTAVAIGVGVTFLTILATVVWLNSNAEGDLRQTSAGPYEFDSVDMRTYLPYDSDDNG